MQETGNKASNIKEIGYKPMLAENKIHGSVWIERRKERSIDLVLGYRGTPESYK